MAGVAGRLDICVHGASVAKKGTQLSQCTKCGNTCFSLLSHCAKRSRILFSFMHWEGAMNVGKQILALFLVASTELGKGRGNLSIVPLWVNLLSWERNEPD